MESFTETPALSSLHLGLQTSQRSRAGAEVDVRVLAGEVLQAVILVEDVDFKICMDFCEKIALKAIVETHDLSFSRGPSRIQAPKPQDPKLLSHGQVSSSRASKSLWQTPLKGPIHTGLRV